MVSVGVGLRYLWPPDDRWKKLMTASAAASERLVEGRLSEFPYAPLVGSTRSHTGTDPVILQVRAAAADYAGSTTCMNATSRRCGVATLLGGREEEAVRILSVAAEQNPQDALVWNDLGVALLAIASRDGDPAQLIAALTAFDAALRNDPMSPHALFNRGIVLDELGLRGPAAHAYRRQLVHDNAVQWTFEAHERLKLLSATPRNDVWRVRLAALQKAAIVGDRSTVDNVVRHFALEARAHAEVLVLSEWAERPQSRKDRLQLAGTVADALMRISGESLLHDAVVALERANPGQQKALVEGHLAYVQARRLYEPRKVDEAFPLFQRAAMNFQLGGSPMQRVARYYIGSCLFDMNRGDEAVAILKDELIDAPSNYRALRGQLMWAIANVYVRKGMLREAMESYRGALAEFEALGEHDYANTMRSNVASLLSLFGDRAEAWRLRRAIFRQLSDAGDAGELQRVVDAAGRTETLEQEWSNAMSLFELAAEPQLRVNPRMVVASLSWHALAAERLGLTAIASDKIAAARQALPGIPPGKLREQATAEVLLLEAATSRDRDPARASSLLDAYLNQAVRTKNLLLVPEALLERARAQRAMGRSEAALRDLREAIRLMRDRSLSSRPDALRESYFQTRDAAVRELADLLAFDDPRAAFAALEESRAEPYGRPATRAASTVDQGTLIVSFAALPDRLIAFVANPQEVRVHRMAIDLKSLSAMCSRVAQDLHDNRPMIDGRRLGELLFGAIQDRLVTAQRVVIIPDGPLTEVPFGALPVAPDETRLIEHVEVVVAPSAAVAIETIALPLDRPLRVIAIGNPAFDRARFPRLPDLPSAEREAAAIVRVYGSGQQITGEQATREAVLGAVERADVLHIAAHGSIAGNDPAKSHLVLAPGAADSGALYLGDIRHAKPGQLVVLAGCHTAAKPGGRRNISTIANAFLAAGASNAIGTLWQIEDDATTDFAIRFHQNLANHRTAAAAFRETQLAMIRSADPRFRSSSMWSAFQLYGSGN